MRGLSRSESERSVSNKMVVKRMKPLEYQSLGSRAKFRNDWTVLEKYNRELVQTETKARKE